MFVAAAMNVRSVRYEPDSPVLQDMALRPYGGCKVTDFRRDLQVVGVLRKRNSFRDA